MSAYMYYANANREAVIKKHGISAKSIGAAGKVLGEEWKKVC